MKTQISRLILLVLVAQRLNISWFLSFFKIPYSKTKKKKFSWSNWAQTNDLNKSVMTNKERVRITWHRHGFCASPKRLEDGCPVGSKPKGPIHQCSSKCWSPKQSEAYPWGCCLRSRHQNPNQHIAYFIEKILLLKIVSWTKVCASDTLGHLLLQHVLPPRGPVGYSLQTTLE